MHLRLFVERSQRGAVHDYSGEHMINNIRFALHQSNPRKVQLTAEYGMRIFFPRDWRAQLVNLRSAGGGKIPSGEAMIAGRKHLDIASMLLRRHWYKTKGPCFRFVGIDASPQRGGLEVLATAERVILQSDVRAARPGDPKPPVEIRRMPVSVLGHGHCGLPDKVQTTVHQTWLDYGPSLSQTRAANADVRQIVSDMGTELAIADYPDVLSACLMSKSRFCDQLAIQAQPPVTQGILALPPAATYLYPLALVVPGTQHILDNALREVLQVLPFWIQWQAQAKTVCQWLASRGHR